MYSAGQINTLGLRIRDKVFDETDIRMLEEIRAEYDSLLLSTSHWVGQALTRAHIASVFAGRSKRTKSLIRKLARPENHGMNLSRMADMVGLRVVVRDRAAQDSAVDALERHFLSDAKTINYLNDGKLYRAVHLIVAEDKSFRSIEVQVRTLPQQLWANESESFGEQVKEGGGPEDIREYLEQLSVTSRHIDNGEAVPAEERASKYFESRATLSLRLPLLGREFDEVTKTQQAAAKMGTYIVVYDNEINQWTQKTFYEPDERKSALQDYQRISGSVDQARFETLILNSSSDAVLRVTHPRFFPEVS
jgi:ppGpp synthetase/RelA/SpoT-type nucleotidyltranferase